jgi:mannose-6-phosphate isomerase-like protein (cupin superfamily)
MKAPANLSEKLGTFTDRFSPRTVATYKNNDIMVAKLEGPFHWHKHDETDDFFLVLKGTLDIELRDRTVTLHPGEVFVVPKGVEHRPVDTARANETVAAYQERAERAEHRWFPFGL